ncbi:hypothetical protein niasHT_025285 [Heterodera trifolii]|uniref:Uncharacterized protein n=1 Tax=Heterodera trifolii TaxID=157864 RepID=A0ABD2KA86_9BILA
MAGEKQEQQQKKQNELRKNMTMLDRAVVTVENARDEAAENDQHQPPAWFNDFQRSLENVYERRDNKGTTTDGTAIILSIFCFGVSVGFIIGSIMFKH